MTHQDSEVYSIVMNRIDPAHCPVIPDEPLMSRAAKAISNARAFGADIFIKPKVRSQCFFIVVFVRPSSAVDSGIVVYVIIHTRNT